ncbi:MAG: M23 family metallopeptidase, partial [Arcanobacterium sp.]|nr:M23 family metallopeptidase [Arcanobacterium sp.]
AAVVATGTLVANAASDTSSVAMPTAQASMLASVNHGSADAATPEVLRDEAGAQDQAKLSAAEEFAAENNVKCVANSGANSLLGSFAEDSSDIFMPMPEGTFRYTSSYGYRSNPFGGGGQLHTGVDMAAPAGTPYYAIADGVVVVNGAKSGRFGNDVVIKHEINGEVFYSWYIHSYADGIFVEEGQEVKAGEHIGNVGSSGYSTGPHLHFEIRDGSEYSAESVEPLQFMKAHGAIDLQARCS